MIYLDLQNVYDNTGKLPYGLEPVSGKNVALYSSYSNEVFSVPAINVDPVFTRTTSFDFNTFQFGCVWGSSGVAYGVSRCNLAVFGYNNGKRVATQSFSFLPNTSAPTARMILASLNTDFRNLTKVRFTTAYVTPTGALGKSKDYSGSTWFDDMEYTIYQRDA